MDAAAQIVAAAAVCAVDRRLVEERIFQYAAPAFLADRRISASCAAVSTVWTDNLEVGRCAVRHLAEHGEYRSAGFVHELGEPFYSEERLIAFRSEMERNGLSVSAFSPVGDGLDASGDLRAWLQSLPKPAAVMAASDMRAADVINACAAAHIHVPSQVAVVGVDHDVSQHVKCGMSISSVVLNSRIMGRQA